MADLAIMVLKLDIHVPRGSDDLAGGAQDDGERHFAAELASSQRRFDPSIHVLERTHGLHHDLRNAWVIHGGQKRAGIFALHQHELNMRADEAGGWKLEPSSGR